MNIWERKMIKAALKMFVGLVAALTISVDENLLPQGVYKYLSPIVCCFNIGNDAACRSNYGI